MESWWLLHVLRVALRMPMRGRVCCQFELETGCALPPLLSPDFFPRGVEAEVPTLAQAAVALLPTA
jgi:hypothetical protein